MFLANILNDPVCQPIKKRYERWYTFMEEIDRVLAAG